MTSGSWGVAGARTLGWNPGDRLTSCSDGSEPASFKYDPFGRRIEETVNGQTTYDLYGASEGGHPIAEYAGGGWYREAIMEGVRWGWLYQNGDGRFTLPDALGSTAVFARDGTVAASRLAECSETFTVTVGTVMEDTHIPLSKWLMGFYMMCASKTQVSALQLKRQLEIGSYRSAWFMCQRIRYALKDRAPADLLTGVVEADETYIGGRVRGRGRRYVGNKTPVVSLVERSGRVRSNVVDSVTGSEITAVLRKHVAKEAVLNTDESPAYKAIGKEFAGHDAVNHHIEDYAHVDESGRLVTTNAVEGFFGNSKRSIDGTHHHISRKHTHLYFAELDFKYNMRKFTDGERTNEAIPKIEGKRLMLRQPKAS